MHVPTGRTEAQDAVGSDRAEPLGPWRDGHARNDVSAAIPLDADTEHAVLDAFPPAPPRSRKRWHPAARVAFRFTFLYFVLYNAPFPLGTIPGTGILAQPFTAFWEAIVPWIGRTILQVPYPITVLPNGSGDTTWNYVQVFALAALALIGTIVWSIVDRRRTSYPKAHVWLRLYVRLVVGASMISYGAYKVIKSQFPSPTLDRLAQPFGDASPMGLLWTFMGYSYAYNVFTGLGELIGGVLLFFRRTTTLGALLLIAVLANIVILNFAFDVPVKLYSSHLLLMAMLLLVPDLRRLVDVLILNRSTGAVTLPPLFASRRNARIALGVKLAFLATVLVTTLNASASTRSTYGDAAPTPPLYGLYEVEEFVRAGAVVAETDTTRWDRVSFARSGFVSIRRGSPDSRAFFRATVDMDARTVRLVAPADSSVVHQLTYSHDGDAIAADERLVLAGTFGGEAVRVTMRRRDDQDYLLMNRGFHWINEYPFNR